MLNSAACVMSNQPILILIGRYSLVGGSKDAMLLQCVKRRDNFVSKAQLFFSFQNHAAMKKNHFFYPVFPTFDFTDSPRSVRITQVHFLNETNELGILSRTKFLKVTGI